MNKLLVFLMIAGFSGTANAAPGDMAWGVKVSTLGAGLELTFEAAHKLNVRVGANYFKTSRQVDVEANTYDLDLKLNSYTALADWYVTDGSLRLTGGVLFNKNNLTGLALASNSYDLNGTLYTSAEVGVLQADVDFKPTAPYLGIGWGNPLSDDRDWLLMIDLGVVFASKPRLDVTSTGGTLSNNSILQNNIVQVEQDFANTKELKYLKYYPVISIGLNYRF